MKDWRQVPSAPPWGQRGLDAGGRRIARALLEALLSDVQQGDLQAPDDRWVEEVLDDYDLALGHAGRPVQLGIAAILRAIEWLPPTTLGKLRPMSRLSLSARVSFLEALETHRVATLTMLFVGVKVPMLLSAFERGAALHETGIDRPTAGARRQRVRSGDGP